MSVFRTIPITISNAADGLSNAVDLEEQDISGIIMSAAWTAAAISFLVAPTLNGTYASAYDEANTEITIASTGAIAGRTILFSDTLATKLRAARFIKFRSGLAGAAVQQAAARDLKIIAAL